MEKISRRNMIKMSAVGTAGLAILGLPLNLSGKDKNSTGKKKKIVVVGAHPDDPETGCGGVMSLLSNAGYDVVCVYLTKGERGIKGKSLEEAAAIRVEECKNACKILGAKPIFMTQIDGECEINPARYNEMYDILEAEQPDVVFTHWPIDSHRDHRICSILTYDAWRKLKFSFELYYYEVSSGMQTQVFSPTDFVDISSVADQKHKACWCHLSQNMDSVYEKTHGPMEYFRGLQCNSKYAEAFIKHHKNLLTFPN